MVVLASSVCTKNGKAVISRQFVEMTRSRIEGLLAAFPKLIGSSNKQHTFVDTESVRYIYQPLDELYMVIITNKQSNILQDIQTLQLFARTISEYCRSTKEAEIIRNAYEILCAFDEVISLGYRENVTVPQIRTITEMDSHEEKLQEMLQKSKEREAIENAKLKAKQLEMQKRESKRAGGGNMMGNSEGFGSSSGYRQSAHLPDPGRQAAPRPSINETSAISAAQTAGTVKKGMQLGGKPKTSDFLEAIKQSEGLNDLSISTQPQQQQQHNSHPASPINRVSAGPVHVLFDEKISAVLNRDGGLESMEVKGELILRLTDADKSKLRIAVATVQDDSLQFKTHPHVDKNLWAQQSVIGTKDPEKPFPVNQSTPVLKWRFTTKDESMIPLIINFWPSPTGSGSIDCSVEYELLAEQMELTNVCISINLASFGSSMPKVDSVDGEFQVNTHTKTLDWRIPSIDKSSSSGTLEFSINGDDVNGLFPVQIHFSSAKPFSKVKVDGVTDVSSGAPVAFTQELLCGTDSYQIV